MREIKFRAWVDGEMYYEEFQRFLGSYGVQFTQFEKTPDALMQYTGLKDKNGKEIYEGDIVKIHYEREYLEVLSVVFNRGQFLREDSQLSLAGDLSYYDGEVIGNIYENKELLDE